MIRSALLLVAAAAAMAVPAAAQAAGTTSCDAPQGTFSVHARGGAACSTARTVIARYRQTRCCSDVVSVRVGGSTWACRVSVLSSGPGEYNPDDTRVHGRIACHRAASRQSVDWQYEGEGD